MRDRICQQNDAVFSRVSICQYANSVCPSVTRVLCVKTAKRIIEILSVHDRPIIVTRWEAPGGF